MASTFSTKEVAVSTTIKKPRVSKANKEEKEKEEPELCSICASHYTTILRKKIVCKFCSKDTCSKCIEQYLLSRHEDAHCLHCRVNYNDQVLQQICTKTYLNHTYFQHRQSVLINRYRAQLPALQGAALAIKRRRDLETNVNNIRNEIGVLAEERAIIGKLYN